MGHRFSRIRRATGTLGASLLFLTATFLSRSAGGYVLAGEKWPDGSQVVVKLALGNAPHVLLDGNTSWNAAIAPVLDMWNQKMRTIHLVGVESNGAAARGDGVNSVAFAPTVFGQSFGKYTLAVTYRMWTGSSTITELDVIMNQLQVFDSYRGPLQFVPPTYIALADIRRVFLHELGHGLGLLHPDDANQHVDAVMNAMISDLETLSRDDVAGIQAMYGAPAPTPTPTPVPTATPTPTPVAASHLANISTRLNVGVRQNVLIGGFIVKGSEPKKLVLRAIGPSLSAAGIAGALSDPMLELYDSAGGLIASNDDWQSGTQAAQIQASGIAPATNAESALIAVLPAGSYTAVVHGRDDAQGIAVVEAYELDSTSTRLVNISTRGRVGLAEQAMIGGLIVEGSANKKVIIRALGPSLGLAGVADALANPTLEVRDGSGNLISANDNWGASAQSAEINATGVAPSNALESAVMASLAPGSYTAVVRGAASDVGVGLIEVFDLEP